jgi:hypothetical protein
VKSASSSAVIAADDTCARGLLAPFRLRQWEQELPKWPARPSTWNGQSSPTYAAASVGDAPICITETPPATPRLPPPPNREHGLASRVAELELELETSQKARQAVELKLESFRLKLSRAEVKGCLC